MLTRPAAFYDAKANLERILAAISEAAENGAKLAVFSELALSGYPFHIWALPYHGASRDRHELELELIPWRTEQIPYIQSFYKEGAVEADGPEYQQLRSACISAGIRAVVGFSERCDGSLFMSQWIIGPDGETIVRRKLKPTSLERVVFGEGDGSDLRVHDTELGRLGALQCWEHTQPLIKYAMASQHEEIHCAGWPVFPPVLPHHSLCGGNRAVIEAYSIETGTYNVFVSSILSEQNLDKIFGDKEPTLPLGGGYSGVVDPEGKVIAVSDPDKDEIVYADVDLDFCYKAKSILDPLGHYSRPDVFEVCAFASPHGLAADTCAAGPL